MDDQSKLPFSKLNYRENDNSYSKSFMIYVKMFVYYPIKYLILLYIFYFILSILKYVHKYGKMGFLKIKRFFEIMLGPGELNLIVFKIPNIFRIFSGIIDLFIGGMYLFVAILFFILSVIGMIPFNLILPHYVAFI